ncbi:MAG TPA: type II CAAX endopeptidase family protein [Blastocatellia bacterium]|nr:type II CAAX endopeptidase family protein [Blastocatellia bacterium]
MATAASGPSPKWYAPQSRALSAIEFIIGASIVIAHNVFRIVPNEVYILAVAGLLSVRLRNGRFSAMGFKRPASWARLTLIAFAAAAVRLLLGALVIDPITERFWAPAALPSIASGITGNISTALLLLLRVWVQAAFGEEIVYRGYLLTRAAEVGKSTTAAYWVAVILVSILFGYGHYYKGPAGIIDSGVAGIILGAAYMLAGRNLWACILAHGFIDTLGVVVLYFGLDS